MSPGKVVTSPTAATSWGSLTTPTTASTTSSTPLRGACAMRCWQNPSPGSCEPTITGPRAMNYNPEKHHRRSTRLKGYDYSRPGAYFVTIVTQARACLFGDVVGGEMRLNGAGRVAEQCWRDIPIHFPHVTVDAFVVMPNHIHGVLWIVDDDGHSVGAKNFSPLFSICLIGISSHHRSGPRSRMPQLKSPGNR